MSMTVCLARGAPFDIRGGHGSLKKQNKTKQKKKTKQTSPAVEAGKKKKNGRKKIQIGWRNGNF